MAQLGSGNGTHWPDSIDTRQVFQNMPAPAPDSDTRVDAEFLNDALTTLIALETILGANPQGAFASVAARLNFYLPDSALPPNVIGFTNTTMVTVPGTQHGLDSSEILWRVWDSNNPRNAIEPNTFTVDPITFNVIMTFAAPQSGTLVLDAPPLRYQTTFTNADAFTVAGSTHGLGTADLFWALYDANTPNATMQPTSITVHPTTFDVVVTFFTGALRSGRLVLSPGRFATGSTFTPLTTGTVPGTYHNFGTSALLYQVYDANTPRANIAPGAVMVDPVTFDVMLEFAVPQAGRILLAAVAPAATPPGLLRTQAVSFTGQRRVGPHDPLPVLMRTVQTLEARMLALEASHTALLAHQTTPPPVAEEPSA